VVDDHVAATDGDRSTYGRVMAPKKRPMAEDRTRATSIALGGIVAGADVDDVLAKLRPLHPRNDTFPGEVLLELAADALEEARVDRSNPLEYEGIRERYLPECEFRGRADHRGSHYALSAAAMIHAGVQPDLLGELEWWANDDFWVFAYLALLAYVRAAADRTDRSPAEIAGAIAIGRGISMPEQWS
jgi:hypothetical protein